VQLPGVHQVVTFIRSVAGDGPDIFTTRHEAVLFAFRLRLSGLSNDYRLVFDSQRVAVYRYAKNAGLTLLDTAAPIDLERVARAHTGDREARRDLADRFRYTVNETLLAPFIADPKFYAVGRSGVSSPHSVTYVRGNAALMERLLRAVLVGYAGSDLHVQISVYGVEPRGGAPAYFAGFRGNSRGNGFNDPDESLALMDWSLARVVTPVAWASSTGERGRLVSAVNDEVRYRDEAPRSPRQQIAARGDLHAIVREHGGDPASIIAEYGRRQQRKVPA
jgi:hypothetical protein